QPPAATADPLGDLAKAQVKAAEAKASAAAAAAAPTAAPAADGFSYFIQAGAFRTQGDADAQRAKLAMLGWEARISEREQNGRPVFRVRVGPFSKRGDAEQLKQKLDGAGVDSALVRVQQ
ncbi:MAG: SPOR domain-containing protein, partial [Comamonas sp.]